MMRTRLIAIFQRPRSILDHRAKEGRSTYFSGNLGGLWVRNKGGQPELRDVTWHVRQKTPTPAQASLDALFVPNPKSAQFRLSLPPPCWRACAQDLAC